MERERVDSLIDLAANIAGKADAIDDILVIYTTKEDGSGVSSMDNGIDVGSGLFLIETFRHWLLTCVNSAKNKPST